MEMQRSSTHSSSHLQTPMLTTLVLAAPENFILEMEIFSEMICRTTSRTDCSKIRLIFNIRIRYDSRRESFYMCIEEHRRRFMQHMQ